MPDSLSRDIAAALLAGAVEISSYQQYGNGTIQVTLKPARPAPRGDESA